MEPAALVAILYGYAISCIFAGLANSSNRYRRPVDVYFAATMLWPIVVIAHFIRGTCRLIVRLIKDE